MICLENISFSYSSGLLALKGFSLEVGRGRSIGIVGPSGCGKSTLLYLIAGLYQPQEGRIESSVRSEAKQQPVSMVFQKDTLLPWLTVEDNIGLFHAFRPTMSKKDLAIRIRELLKLASLEGFEKAYPYELSGGMKRRVAFLSAVAPMPALLLLDEPFSALDEPTRVTIHQDVFKIVRGLGTTVVLVTHDLAEAISLCDEVVILTNRPASVFSQHPIPFGHERNMLHLRHERAFLDIYGELWEELSQQIASGQPPREKREIR